MWKIRKGNPCGCPSLLGNQYPERFLAKQLNRARQNGNEREVVARIILSRLEVDIKNISNVFVAKTGRSWKPCEKGI